VYEELTPVPQDDLGHNLSDADIVCGGGGDRGRREAGRCEEGEYRKTMWPQYFGSFEVDLSARALRFWRLRALVALAVARAL
jgi:hypothetical protein